MDGKALVLFGGIGLSLSICFVRQRGSSRTAGGREEDNMRSMSISAVESMVTRTCMSGLVFCTIIAAGPRRCGGMIFEDIPGFPCTAVEHPAWALPGLDLSFETPLVEVADDESFLVIGDRRNRTVVLLDRAGAVTKLDIGISIEDVQAAGHPVVLPEHWKRIGMKPRIDLTAIALRDRVIYVLSQIYLPLLPSEEPSVLESHSFRGLQRFDASGTSLGGWLKEIRWTESDRKIPHAMTVDATGNVYVTGFGGVIVGYDRDGKIFKRWKLLTEEAEKYWLNPEKVAPDDDPRAKAMPSAMYQKLLEEERARQSAFKADLKRMGEVKHATFEYVRTPIIPAAAQGLALDEEGNFYLSGTGLGGILKMTPLGEVSRFRLPPIHGGNLEQDNSRDIAYDDGMLYVAGNSTGVFTYDAAGRFLGHIRSGKRYGSDTQISLTEDGMIYVADRTWLPQHGYWLEVFVPQ